LNGIYVLLYIATACKENTHISAIKYLYYGDLEILKQAKFYFFHGTEVLKFLRGRGRGNSDGRLAKSNCLILL